ncbi:MAG: hypothetical protein E6017_23665 [Kluyvera cryocrescens]|uniref:hypothetical protein n=1 Tax=Enterobacter roggenkampii TaxID=1812935 RepID=UPI0024338867|nr:hypothetical protein [Citrobacter freundii]MDU5688585.1 hypothetical protein [Kluyvera cryocrescens]HDR2162940.1 hypothetical protein [Enterobacter cancerogenus]WFW13972.1 hypothetical protein NFJ59_04210 [Citrobacter freundii]HDR2168003.1 hypothetical protein [Enterobacter cancerogenus]HDR2270429.1 hypothetical protein [Enterobacter cancerogenus]
MKTEIERRAALALKTLPKKIHHEAIRAIIELEYLVNLQGMLSNEEIAKLPNVRLLGSGSFRDIYSYGKNDARIKIVFSINKAGGEISISDIALPEQLEGE